MDESFRNPKRPLEDVPGHPLVTQAEIDLRYTLKAENKTVGPRYNDDTGQFMWLESMEVPNLTAWNDTVNWVADACDDLQSTANTFFLSKKNTTVFGKLSERMAFLDLLIPTVEQFYSTNFGSWVLANWPTHQYVNAFTNWLYRIQWAGATVIGQQVIAAVKQYISNRNELRHLQGYNSHYITFDQHLYDDWSYLGLLHNEDGLTPHSDPEDYWENTSATIKHLTNTEMYIDLTHPWKLQFDVELGAEINGIGFKGRDHSGTTDINYFTKYNDKLRVPRLHNGYLSFTGTFGTLVSQQAYVSGHYIESDEDLFDGRQIIEIECIPSTNVLHPYQTKICYRTIDTWSGTTKELAYEILTYGANNNTSIDIMDIRFYEAVKKIYHIDLF